uniref:Uncharacterized protein n=1 Tax=Labrus bergylta TaxID=56723 RepID=A0A3Q3G7G4_9LABR
MRHRKRQNKIDFYVVDYVFIKTQPKNSTRAYLPLVSSASSRLSVLYTDTKCSHPKLRSVCDVLCSVTAISSAACVRVTPVIIKLEPHSDFHIANNAACKSLGWLLFLVLHAPTEQVNLSSLSYKSSRVTQLVQTS